MADTLTFITVTNKNGRIDRRQLSRIRSHAAYKTYHREDEEARKSADVLQRLSKIYLGPILVTGAIPGQSRDQLLAMLRSFESYHSWLETTVKLLRLDMDPKLVRNIILRHLKARSESSLNIMVIASEAQVNAIAGVEGLHNPDKQMGIALSSLRARLSEPVQRMEQDDVFCAPVGHLFFDLFRGGSNMIMHCLGFYRMLDAVGGLRGIKNPGVRAMACTVDIIFSVCLKRRPHCTRIFAPRLELHSTLESTPNVVRLCPLFHISEMSNLPTVNRHISARARSQLDECWDIFSNLVRSYRQADGHTYRRSPSEASSDYEVKTGITLADDTPVNRAIEVAASLWCRSIQTMTPFDIYENKADVIYLYSLLRQTKLYAWSGVPFVYFWIQLVGLTSSLDPSLELQMEKGYFAAELMRCVWTFGVVMNQETQEALMSQLWLTVTLQGLDATSSEGVSRDNQVQFNTLFNRS